MMRVAALLLCALAACTPAPPATPPVPATPPPPDPPREIASATVFGQVVNARGNPIAHAMVNVHSADAACRPLDREVGAVSDERGEYLATAEIDTAAATRGCVLVEARSGGASGVATAEVEFTTGSPRVRVDVRMDRIEPLTQSEAERLVRILADAINEPAQNAADLSLYVLHGPEALRVALEQYRSILHRVVDVRPLPRAAHDPRRFPFELRAANGRTSQVDVYQEDLTRLHSPLLDYGFRSERFMNAYVRAIASGDAVRLAQILNPDDVDFPVERARDMIVDYRERYGDTATIRAEFVDIDEARATIVWRLRGGNGVTETIELGFGDGLIGVKGLHDH